MNDDLHSYLEPELEARIVALILGEASAFEREELERILEEQPEAAIFKRRLEAVHGLLGEAEKPVNDFAWKLTNKRREKVLAVLREGQEQVVIVENQRESRIKKAARRSLYGVAACMMLSLIMAIFVVIIPGKKMASSKSFSALPLITEEELQAQAEIVQEDRKALTTLVQEYGIPYFDDRSSSTVGVTEESLYRRAEEKLDDLKSDKKKLEAQLGDLVKSSAIFELKALDQKIEKMEAVVGTKKDKTVDLSMQVHEYNSARERFEESRDKLAKMKEATSGDDSSLGRRRVSLGMTPQAKESDAFANYAESVAGKKIEANRGLANTREGGLQKDLSLLSSDGRSQSIAGALAEIEDAQVALGTPLGTTGLITGVDDEGEKASEYEPPELPNKIAGGISGNQANFGFLVTPATPTELDGDGFSDDFVQIPNIPSAPNQEVSGIVTAGTRSGAAAVSRNNIDAILNQPELAKKPDVRGRRREIAQARPKKKTERKPSVPSPEGEKTHWDFEFSDTEPSVDSVRSGEEFADSFGVDGVSDATEFDWKTSSEEGERRLAGKDKVISKKQGQKKNAEAFGESDKGGYIAGRASLRGQGRRTLYTNADDVVWSEASPDVVVPPALDSDGDGLSRDAFILPESKRVKIPGVPNDSLEDQELIRRQSAAVAADELLKAGRKAYAEGDYDEAVRSYRASLDTLPPGTATKERRELFRQHLSDGAQALAQQHRRTGKYDEARSLLEGVLKGDPGNTVAQKELDYIDDPIRTNLSLNYELTKDIDEVRRHLYKAEGYYDLGLYDKAEEEAKKVLRIDPYNKAARRRVERTQAVKSDYYRAAYDEARARMLMEVDQAWEPAVPPIANEVDSGVVGNASVVSKLDQVIIPTVDFKNTTIEEALDFLRVRSMELDTAELDPSKKGMNFVGHIPEGTKIDVLKMENVSVRDVLNKIAETTSLTLEVEDYAVVLCAKPVDWTPKKLPDEQSLTTEGQLRLNVLPLLDLKTTTIEETLDFMSARSRELGGDSSPIKFKFEHDGIKNLTVDNLYLSSVPFETALRYVADKTNTRYRIEGDQVIFYSETVSAPVKPEPFETLTAQKSDSTFSLNVSDVSFKLAKSSLAEGKWPEASKVRPEEFVNALDYDDRKPSQSEKVACVIEQGAHPFMQQRNLMRVSMSTAALGRNASTPLRLTILLDQSGSMERADRAESVRRAFALLTAQLTANDEVTLIGFARTPRLLAERVKGNESGKLVEVVSQTLTEGGTNLEAALTSGIQLAKQQFASDAQNRIILLTDGAANLGDALPENLAKLVGQMRDQNIAFDACGVGADGLNDDILTSLTKQGDGRYYFLDRPEDADAGFARQIAGALRPAAKNVKVQVIFNPERVSKFKLYGFEKHLLKKEDFRNDTVDAAEMAAEESGIALYHFEALPEGRGEVGTVSVRFLDTASGQMVERTWTIPFQPEAQSFSDAEPSLQLAGTAGLFAEKLKGSVVGERVDLKRLRQSAEALRAHFKDARFYELLTMLQQAGE